MYCYVWSFVVQPECAKDFQAAYGSDGEWTRLFRSDPGYISTSLLADRHNPHHFLTIDLWSSYEAWASFRKRYAEQFESLDREFEQWTVEKAQVGSFDVMGTGAFASSRKRDE
jgi:heme-degrading monooxygenase HmoA